MFFWHDGHFWISSRTPRFSSTATPPEHLFRKKPSLTACCQKKQEEFSHVILANFLFSSRIIYLDLTDVICIEATVIRTC